jgi:hypothetical protein
MNPGRQALRAHHAKTRILPRGGETLWTFLRRSRLRARSVIGVAWQNSCCCTSWEHVSLTHLCMQRWAKLAQRVREPGRWFRSYPRRRPLVLPKGTAAAAACQVSQPRVTHVSLSRKNAHARLQVCKPACIVFLQLGSPPTKVGVKANASISHDISGLTTTGGSRSWTRRL